METGFDGEKLKKALRWPNVKKAVFSFLSRQGRTFIFILAVAGTAYCVFIWYSTIYRPEWSESKKQEYINNKDRGVLFDRAKFEEIMKNSQARKNELEKTPESVNDIFRLKQ